MLVLPRLATLDTWNLLAQAVTFALRPYQEAMLDSARSMLRAGERSVLLQAPTGSGKTALAAKMLATSAERGFTSWFLVHRRELVVQSVLTLTASSGAAVGIVAAGFPAEPQHLIQVCSVGTLRRRASKLARPRLIVWDECHHAPAASWSDLHAQYPDALHVGLSATPERLDGTGLGPWFKNLILGPSVASLIEDGFLSDYRLYAPQGPDLKGVHTIAGDFNRKELSAAMRESSVTGDVIQHYRKHADGKRMVLFAWSVEASIELARRFNANGIASEHVDGKTDDRTRDDAMQRFREGTTRVLCNVDLFGEGIDVPSIEAVALLRPTQSLGLYMQQVGRALRPAPGKEYAVILDHAGNCRRHGLPDDDRDWSLEGRKRKPSDREAPIRQCPACYAVTGAAATACKACGYVFQAAPREIEQVSGELAEVDAVAARRARAMEQGQADTVEALTALGRARGMRFPEQWARHVVAARERKREAA